MSLLQSSRELPRLHSGGKLGDNEKVGATLTPKLKIALYERMVTKDKAKLLEGTQHERKIILIRVMQCSYVWKIPGNPYELANIIEPSLNCLDAGDKTMAKMFSDNVYGVFCYSIITGGEPKYGDLCDFLGVALAEMDCPESADMEDHCAAVMVNAGCTNSALHLLSSDSIDTDTNTSGFECLQMLDDCITNRSSELMPMNYAANAIAATPYWYQKLGRLGKCLSTLREFAPKIKAHCQTVLFMSKMPTDSTIKVLTDVCTDVAYWEASIPNIDSCGFFAGPLCGN